MDLTFIRFRVIDTSIPKEGGDAVFSATIRPEVLKMLREQYPSGTRVELIEMNDPYRVMPPGLKGTVQMVDDAGGIHVNWDNGSTLAAIHGFDRIRKCD